MSLCPVSIRAGPHLLVNQTILQVVRLQGDCALDMIKCADAVAKVLMHNSAEKKPVTAARSLCHCIQRAACLGKQAGIDIVLCRRIGRAAGIRMSAAVFMGAIPLLRTAGGGFLFLGVFDLLIGGVDFVHLLRGGLIARI